MIAFDDEKIFSCLTELFLKVFKLIGKEKKIQKSRRKCFNKCVNGWK